MRSKLWMYKFFLIILFTVFSWFLLWWALCPGYLQKRCWFGIRQNGDTEIKLAKAKYGPVLMQSELLKNFRTDVESTEECRLQLLSVWGKRETIFRLSFIFCVYWLFICFFILKKQTVKGCSSKLDC